MTRSRKGGATIVAVAGTAESATAEEVEAAVEASLLEGVPRVILQLSAAKLLPTAVWGMAMACLRRCRSAGGDLALVGLTGAVSRSFRSLGLSGFLLSFDDEAEALAKIGSAPAEPGRSAEVAPVEAPVAARDELRDLRLTLDVARAGVAEAESARARARAEADEAEERIERERRALLELERRLGFLEASSGRMSAAPTAPLQISDLPVDAIESAPPESGRAAAAASDRVTSSQPSAAVGASPRADKSRSGRERHRKAEARAAAAERGRSADAAVRAAVPTDPERGAQAPPAAPFEAPPKPKRIPAEGLALTAVHLPLVIRWSGGGKWRGYTAALGPGGVRLEGDAAGVAEGPVEAELHLDATTPAPWIGATALQMDGQVLLAFDPGELDALLVIRRFGKEFLGWG